MSKAPKSGENQGRTDHETVAFYSQAAKQGDDSAKKWLRTNYHEKLYGSLKSEQLNHMLAVTDLLIKKHPMLNDAQALALSIPVIVEFFLFSSLPRELSRIVVSFLCFLTMDNFNVPNGD